MTKIFLFEDLIDKRNYKEILYNLKVIKDVKVLVIIKNY